MEIKDKKSGFKIIDGGLMESAYTSRKEFISAYVTDTRLMGVVTIIGRWVLPDNIRNTEMYQFFYIDCTGGIQEYERVFFSEEDAENSIAEIKRIETRMTGGLGALRVAISQEEMSFLLSFYSRYNNSDDNSLPGPTGEYSFLISDSHTLTDSQEARLMEKQCTDIKNTYQAVHYFIMRAFDRDFSGARYLMRGEFEIDLFSELGVLTVIKNTIGDAGPSNEATDSNYFSTDSGDDFSTFSTRLSYSCKTLVCDEQNRYYLVVTQVTTENKNIVKFEAVSYLKITQKEAILIDNRPEYITVFDFIGSGLEIDETSTKLLSRALVTEHVAGRTFMIYSTNNDHVMSRIFRLGDDIKGLYYVLDTGQIVLAAYSLENIRLLERDIMRSKYADLLMPATKYQFQERIMFDFINSEMQNFEDFVDVVAEDEDFIEDDSELYSQDDDDIDYFFEEKSGHDFYEYLLSSREADLTDDGENFDSKSDGSISNGRVTSFDEIKDKLLSVNFQNSSSGTAGTKGERTDDLSPISEIGAPEKSKEKEHISGEDGDNKNPAKKSNASHGGSANAHDDDADK